MIQLRLLILTLLTCSLTLLPVQAGIVEDVDQLPTSDDYEKLMIEGVQTERVEKMDEQESFGGSTAGRSGSGRRQAESREKKNDPESDAEAEEEAKADSPRPSFKKKSGSGMFVIGLLLFLILAVGVYLIRNRND